MKNPVAVRYGDSIDMIKADRIIFATGNKNKIREASQILADFDIPVISMKEAGAEADPEENGTTFEENAMIKARAVAEVLREKKEEIGAEKSDEKEDRKPELAEGDSDREVYGDIVIADDSGLVIDALNGEPGIYSARYMGHETSYHIKNNNLIERLTGVPDEKRTARFVCAIAAVLPDGRELSTTGYYEGAIGYEEKGENGFGYDPIFYLPDVNKYSAELSDEEKNARSHRGQALREMRDMLEKVM